MYLTFAKDSHNGRRKLESLTTCEGLHTSEKSHDLVHPQSWTSELQQLEPLQAPSANPLHRPHILFSRAGSWQAPSHEERLRVSCSVLGAPARYILLLVDTTHFHFDLTPNISVFPQDWDTKRAATACRYCFNSPMPLASEVVEKPEPATETNANPLSRPHTSVSLAAIAKRSQVKARVSCCLERQVISSFLVRLYKLAVNLRSDLGCRYRPRLVIQLCGELSVNSNCR